MMLRCLELQLLLNSPPPAALVRWRLDDACIPLDVPSWNWKSHTNGTAYYKFPRVLVDAMSKEMTVLPFDGNLGLGVPGQVWSQ